MPDPLMTRYRNRNTSPAWRRLHQAGLDFRSRWRKTAPTRTNDARHLEATAVLLVCVAILVTGYWLDDASAAWRRSLPPGLVSGFFEPVTRLGDSAYIFILSALVAILATIARGLGASRHVDATLGLLAGRATFVFGVAAFSGLLSQLIKHLFGRARPSLYEIVGPFHFDAFAFTSRYASFPSGHSVTAFAAATAIGWFAPRLRWPLYGLAALVALSRVALGAHYPSDVLAGAMLGIGSALALRRAFAARRIVFRSRGRSVETRRGRPGLLALREVPLWRE
jgi:membrane-associated phospholipid phosphatase